MISTIHELIIEYYDMREGEYIKDFHSAFLIENGRKSFILKYRVLKHVVEQRKRDYYELEELKQLFTDFYNLVENENYVIVSNGEQNDSFLFLEKLPKRGKGVVLVLEISVQADDKYVIKTGFYRAASKIKKLLK